VHEFIFVMKLRTYIHNPAAYEARTILDYNEIRSMQRLSISHLIEIR
jgi:hypothetical protein